MSSQKDSLVERILNSIFYKTSLGKAGKISRNSQGILQLLKNALNKTKDLGVGGVFDGIREKVVLLGRLLRAYAKGDYRYVANKNLITIIAGLVYFISPIDIIPDFLPFVGFADDIALLTFIIGSMKEELEKFELWEMNNN